MSVRKQRMYLRAYTPLCATDVLMPGGDWGRDRVVAAVKQLRGFADFFRLKQTEEDLQDGIMNSNGEEESGKVQPALQANGLPSVRDGKPK